MILPPPRSTLFPTRRSSDLGLHARRRYQEHSSDGLRYGPGGSHWRGEESAPRSIVRSEEHTSELQSHVNLVCRLLLEKKNEKDEDEDEQEMDDADDRGDSHI